MTSRRLQLGSLIAAAVLVFEAGGALPASPARAAERRPSSPAGADLDALPGERVDLRTATSRTIRNADGTFTTTLACAPIHFRDAKGKWSAIDDRAVPNGRGGWKNAANAFRIDLEDRMGPAFLSVAADGSAFSMGLEDSSAGVQALTQNPGGSVAAIGEATGFDDPVGNFWAGVQVAHEMSPRDKAR